MFDIFRDEGVSVDVVATSEISISLTLDPRRAARQLRPHQGPACACPCGAHAARRTCHVGLARLVASSRSSMTCVWALGPAPA